MEEDKFMFVFFVHSQNKITCHLTNHFLFLRIILFIFCAQMCPKSVYHCDNQPEIAPALSQRLQRFKVKNLI